MRPRGECFLFVDGLAVAVFDEILVPLFFAFELVFARYRQAFFSTLPLFAVVLGVTPAVMAQRGFSSLLYLITATLVKGWDTDIGDDAPFLRVT